MRIAVIGAGSWGTATAHLLAEKGYTCHLWARDPELARAINEEHHNPRYLNLLKIAANVQAHHELAAAVAGAEVVIMAVPSHALRRLAEQVRDALKTKPIFVSLTKGLETSTLLRMSEVIKQVMSVDSRRVGVLSGPNHAEEVSRGIPSATVVSCVDKETARFLQELFMTPYFRVYTNADIIGVELGAAIKNVIAIAAGISDGLGYGDNTKASLMTRGLAEMTRLGVAAGAVKSTFAGLSGVGDLIATCTSRHSRNRAAGERLAQGAALAEIEQGTRMVAEGINTCVAVVEKASALGVDMPISRAVYQVIYKGKNPSLCVGELMNRGAVDEQEMY